MRNMSNVGNVVSRFKRLDKRRQLLVAVLAVLLASMALLGVLQLISRTHLSASEQAAVDASTKAASGFKKDSDAYTFAQLNKAVEYAGENKCTEARAVYQEATGHTNGLPASDVESYKKRIEDLCSGNATQRPRNNPF